MLAVDQVRPNAHVIISVDLTLRTLQLLCHLDGAVRIFMKVVGRTFFIGVRVAEKLRSRRHIGKIELQFVTGLHLVPLEIAFCVWHLLVEQRVSFNLQSELRTYLFAYF